MQKHIKSFDGTRINYDVERGKNKKYFLVFLHGAGGDLTDWTGIREFFYKQGISTLAIDLRGHGKSGKPKLLEDYKINKFTQDVREIIKKENISKPILVGHSLGGMITLTFHNLYPKISKEYVIIGSSYKTPRRLKSIFKKFASIVNWFNKKFRTIFPKRRNKYDKNKKFFKNLKDDSIIKIFFDALRTSFKSWLFTFENINNFDGQNILKTITKPVLILSGGKDSIVNVNNSRKLHKLIENSTLKIFPREDHRIIVSKPNVISKEILSFIKKK